MRVLSNLSPNHSPCPNLRIIASPFSISTAMEAFITSWFTHTWTCEFFHQIINIITILDSNPLVKHYFNYFFLDIACKTPFSKDVQEMNITIYEWSFLQNPIYYSKNNILINHMTSQELVQLLGHYVSVGGHTSL